MDRLYRKTFKKIAGIPMNSPNRVVNQMIGSLEDYYKKGIKRIEIKVNIRYETRWEEKQRLKK